jgi:hypothetical protein
MTKIHMFNLQKRNFDDVVLACLNNIVTGPGLSRKATVKPIAADLCELYQHATTPGMAAFLKRAFEDKHEEAQPEFVAAWSRDYGTQSDKVWCVQPHRRTTCFIYALMTGKCCPSQVSAPRRTHGEAGVGVPTTNNGLEANNDIIKCQLGPDGKKIRLAPMELLKQLLDAMRYMSMRSSDPVPKNALASVGVSDYATKKYVHR